MKPPTNVVVIANERSFDSRQIAKKYGDAYSLPAKQRINIQCASSEEVPLNEYRRNIENAVFQHLRKHDLYETVDYLVLTKGIPIRIREGGFSVDAALMVAPMRLPFRRGVTEWHFNPFFDSKGAFSRKKTGFHLATRLDGYLADHAIRLVDNSKKAKQKKGIFMLDQDPTRKGGSYDLVNSSMQSAARLLKQKGFEVIFDQTKDFLGDRGDLMGYYSWGSNDAHFAQARYRRLRFYPGAIAETAVSTSARTFKRTDQGQSLIADLIESGVTGVKGYVSEPYAEALCRAAILFERYTAGRNLAESFYAASPFLLWKDLVIGDPLCAPFAK
ncbi:MAG: TIGR03790 family protein [Armatimonadetes bacterium]|nr:TIGR03790 family protein [Armatimonadota bacterium]